MVKVIRRFFDFCGAANRKKFVTSIWLGVLLALFEALKIPAIAVMMRALLPVELGGNGGITTRDILLSLGIMLLSILGSGLAKAKATMLQTEAGYDTCAMKRIEIAEHMRYLPMGYFNENSLGQITSVTTNVMENLENVATRVVMMVAQGLLTTLLIIGMLSLFDWRVALVLLVGFGVFLLMNGNLQTAAGKMAGRKIAADEKLVEKVLEYIQIRRAEHRDRGECQDQHRHGDDADPPHDGPDLHRQADRRGHDGAVLHAVRGGQNGRADGHTDGHILVHRVCESRDCGQLLGAAARGGHECGPGAGDPGRAPDGHFRG